MTPLCSLTLYIQSVRVPSSCWLHYHVGGVITRESSLLVADERTFRTQFAIDVRTRCEAIAIDRTHKTVDLRNAATGAVTTEAYDKLVLSPGATPITPPLPGIDLPGVFRVRTVPDVKAIREWIEGHTALSSGLDAYTGFQTVLPAQRAVVVGGGFIGLEMAENLVHLGLQVTLLQRDSQLLSPMDPEMALYVERHVTRNGVQLVLSADVTEFRQAVHGALEVLTADGKAYPADLVVLASVCARRPGWRRTPGWRSARAAGFASTIKCAPAIRTSSPWAMPWR